MKTFSTLSTSTRFINIHLSCHQIFIKCKDLLLLYTFLLYVLKFHSLKFKQKVTKNLLLFLTLMSIKTIVLQDFFLLADLYFKISDFQKR